MLFIVLYLLVGIGAARVTRAKFPRIVQPELISERHSSYCPRSLTYDVEFYPLGKKEPERAKRMCTSGVACKMTYQSAANREGFVASTLVMWPLYMLGWLLLADRLTPKRLSEGERLQLEFDKNPELKRIHNELMEQYRIEGYQNESLPSGSD